MNYVTLEVEIDHGKLIAKQPERLPVSGKGLLTILPPSTETEVRSRVQLPLVIGDGRRIINPTREELDDSLWD